MGDVGLCWVMLGDVVDVVSTNLRLLPGGQVLLAASEDRRGGVRGFQER